MAFKRTIDEVIFSSDIPDYFSGPIPDQTTDWTEAEFKIPPRFEETTSFRLNQTRHEVLTLLKMMLTQMELRNGKDYIFVTPKQYDKDSSIIKTIKFRDSGDALLAIMRWMGSDYYKGIYRP